MTLWRVARLTRQAAQLESAARNPGRYARNRVKSKAFGAVGGWRAWSRFWRA